MLTPPYHLRVLVLLAVLSSAGCTAPWNALVRYSPEPASDWEAGNMGVYAAILRDLASEWTLTGLAIPDTSEKRPGFVAVVGMGGGVVQGHWVDSLKEQVAEVLDDSSLSVPMDRDEVLAVMDRLGLTVEPVASESMMSPATTRPVPWLLMSRPGFNQKGTLAAVRVTFWCGFLCGHGATILLARQPGYRWRVWRYHAHWFS